MVTLRNALQAARTFRTRLNCILRMYSSVQIHRIQTSIDQVANLYPLLRCANPALGTDHSSRGQVRPRKLEFQFLLVSREI
jgi:hypothetical protein